VAWENGNNVLGVSCLPFGIRMAYTTFVGLKSAARLTVGVAGKAD
jgi:hypothetical protein